MLSRRLEDFTAVAINTNTRPPTQPQPNRPTTAQLSIRIERWSTDEERDTLLAIVKQQESNINSMNRELLRALQRLPRVGHIREPTTLAWDLRFTRQAPLDDGGRRIVLGTDRPMPFWEIRDRPRSFDYPFTVIEMHLNKENRGEGKLLTDTRIFIDPRTNDLGAGALRHPAGAPQSNQAAALSAIVAESVGSTAERLVFESPRPPSSAKTPSQPVKCAGGGGTREASRARRARNRQDADVRQDADSPSRL